MNENIKYNLQENKDEKDLLNALNMINDMVDSNPEEALDYLNALLETLNYHKYQEGIFKPVEEVINTLKFFLSIDDIDKCIWLIEFIQKYYNPNIRQTLMETFIKEEHFELCVLFQKYLPKD
jgi:hypothetical protein